MESHILSAIKVEMELHPVFNNGRYLSTLCYGSCYFDKKKRGGGVGGLATPNYFPVKISSLVLFDDGSGIELVLNVVYHTS